MWMLAPDAYLRLVHDAGWPVEQFPTWLAGLLQRMFPLMSPRVTQYPRSRACGGGGVHARATSDPGLGAISVETDAPLPPKSAIWTLSTGPDPCNRTRGPIKRLMARLLPDLEASCL